MIALPKARGKPGLQAVRGEGYLPRIGWGIVGYWGVFVGDSGYLGVFGVLGAASTPPWVTRPSARELHSCPRFVGHLRPHAARGGGTR